MPGTDEQQDMTSPQTRRWEWALLIAVLLFSLSLGAASLLQYMDTPLFTVPFTDEESYVNWARDVVEGKPVSIFYQDPLYPYFLALVFKITGVPEMGRDHPAWLMVRLLQVFMGVGTVGLVFYSARKLGGPIAAAAAIVLAAFYQGLYFYELLLIKTCLATLVSAGVLAAGVACAHTPLKKPRWVALGLLLGAAALLRGNFLALLLFVLAWAVYINRKQGKKGLVRAALVLLGAMIALSPATVHNLRKGDFVLTTSQAGPNFYIGNNPIADGSYVKLPFQESAHPSYEARDFRKEAAKRAGEKLKPSEVSRFWLEQGMEWIGNNPVQALELYAYKLLLMVHQYEIPDNQSFYLVRDKLVPALRIPILNLGMLWAAALAGVIVVGFSDRRVSFAVMMLLVYVAAAAAFFVLSRYRLAVVPPLAALGGAYLAWLLRKLGKKSFIKPAASLAVVGLVLLASHWPLPQENEYQCYNMMAIAYVRTGRPQSSIPHFVKALEMKPGDPIVTKNLRMALDMLPREPRLLLKIAGKWEAREKRHLAALLYEKALHERPDLYKVRIHLARLYGPELGRYKKARQHLMKALEQKPQNAAVMVMIGNCHYELKNLDAAKEWWKKALVADPENSDARRNLRTLKRGEHK